MRFLTSAILFLVKYAFTLLLSYINLNPAWIGNHIHNKLLDEITYPLLNVSGTGVEVWEWLNNSIPYFKMDMIICSYRIKIN